MIKAAWYSPFIPMSEFNAAFSPLDQAGKVFHNGAVAIMAEGGHMGGVVKTALFHIDSLRQLEPRLKSLAERLGIGRPPPPRPAPRRGKKRKVKRKSTE